MPMLDAKALEIDPEGMAFLTSVLRQRPAAPTIQLKATARPKTIQPRVRVHFRFMKRLKDSLHVVV